ncbi:NAD(P)H-hydrate epimerase, partial [Leclercia adecarboxylata]|nr:NAD(P)H-hydrate epimerase [Leclercia adecarboxylata]
MSQQAEQAFIAAGGAVAHFDGGLPPVDLPVDALFGTGLNPAPAGGAAALINPITASGLPGISLDGRQCRGCDR